MHDRPFELYFAYETSDAPLPVALEMECFILGIECANGDVYELSVWTETYLTRLLTQDHESGKRLGSQYFMAPDLAGYGQEIHSHT